MHIKLGADTLLRIKDRNAFSYNLEKEKHLGICGHPLVQRRAQQGVLSSVQRGTCDDVRGCHTGMFGVYSSAKKDRCLGVLFTVFSRRKIQEDADEILMGLRSPLCLSKSVFQLSRCLSQPASPPPSSSLFLWGGLVRRFHPIVSTRVGPSQPPGGSDGIFLF
jgi:hypothetical protein